VSNGRGKGTKDTVFIRNRNGVSSVKPVPNKHWSFIVPFPPLPVLTTSNRSLVPTEPTRQTMWTT